MRFKTSTLLWLAAALVVLAGFFLALSANMNRERSYMFVEDFETCAAAGYPVAETMPPQCKTPDGRIFMKDPMQYATTTRSGTATTSQASVGLGCKIGGCSAQLCVSDASPDVVSTCEYRVEYGCYRNATCEKQKDGACGWTQTPLLKACLQSAAGGGSAASTY